MTWHPGRGSFRTGHEAQAEARCRRFKTGIALCLIMMARTVVSVKPKQAGMGNSD